MKKINWKSIFESGDVTTIGKESNTLIELCSKLGNKHNCRITVDAYISAHRRWCGGGRPSDVLTKDKPEKEQIQKVVVTRQEKLTMAGLRKQNRDLADALFEEQGKLAALLDINKKRPKPKSIKKTKTKAEKATAVCLLSDLHMEERVDASGVNDVNHYTPAIAKKRLEACFRGFVRKVRMHEADGVQIDELVLWLGGDLINGYIHPELIEANHMTPLDAIHFVFDCVIAGVEYLKAELSCVIHIKTNYGNHGRVGFAKNISLSAANSFEHALYKFIAKHYATTQDNRVSVEVATGPFLYVPIHGYMFRFTHGDSLKFGRGAALWGTAARTCEKLNTHVKADYAVFGHVHRAGFCEKMISNGSMIGTGSYGLFIAAEHEDAEQVFFLVRPKWGVTDFSTIKVENVR